jgi:hypothetical protein
LGRFLPYFPAFTSELHDFFEAVIFAGGLGKQTDFKGGLLIRRQNDWRFFGLDLSGLHSVLSFGIILDRFDLQHKKNRRFGRSPALLVWRSLPSRLTAGHRMPFNGRLAALGALFRVLGLQVAGRFQTALYGLYLQSFAK